MEIFQYIDRFIEKDLSPREEDILFEKLAADRELREHLHSSVMLERGMGKRMAALAPTASETSGVFGALGFAPAGISSVGSGGAAVASSTGLNSIWASIVTLILGIGSFIGLETIAPELMNSRGDVSTFVSSEALIQPEPELVQVMTLPSETSINENISIAKVDLNSNEISTTDKTSETGKGEDLIAESKAENNERRLTNRQDKQSENTIGANLNTKAKKWNDKIGVSNTVASSSLISDGTLDNKNIFSFAEEMSNIRSLASDENAIYGSDSETEKEFDLSNMRIEFRNLSAFSSPSEDFNASADPNLSNIGVSFFVLPVSKHLELGLSYDRKVYFLEYEATTDMGQFEFRQNTLYSSLMAQAQYIPINNWNSITPFLRAGVGASSIGPTVGLSGGFYYNIIGGIDAMVGLDGQALFFNIEDTWYRSENYGAVIGVSVEI